MPESPSAAMLPAYTRQCAICHDIIQNTVVGLFCGVDQAIIATLLVMQRR